MRYAWLLRNCAVRECFFLTSAYIFFGLVLSRQKSKFVEEVLELDRNFKLQMIENLIGHHWIAFSSPFGISLIYQFFGLKDLKCVQIESFWIASKAIWCLIIKKPTNINKFIWRLSQISQIFRFQLLSLSHAFVFLIHKRLSSKHALHPYCYLYQHYLTGMVEWLRLKVKPK